MQSEGDRLSPPTRQRLYEFMIIDGLIRGDHALVRESTLQWLLLVPDTLHAVREALSQTHREPNITLTFDRDQERVVSLNMAEVGIGLSDVLALNATPISIHNH